jgi:PilZ domain
MGEDNRRKHERIEFTRPIRVTAPTPMDGTGIDLSAGGASVRLPAQIAVGSAVQVDLFGDGKAVPGTVRLSLPHPDGGFRVGIQWAQENARLVADWQSRSK